MKQFYFIILSTFIIGMCAGAYIFIASREEDPLFDFSDTETQSFEIIADAYGGCARGGSCASYRIAEDGSYTYLVPSRDGEPLRTSGALAKDELQALKRLVGSTDLSTLEISTFTGSCPIMYDGLGFTYAIQTDEESYTFDTCEQALGEERLFEILEEYFTTFSETR